MTLPLAASMGILPTAAPAAAQRTADPKPDMLALEPIGGYTKIANVRIITTELCPEQSEVMVARIAGGGFKPNSNVFGNTELALVPKMPDGSGYVAPIFADWDYLASAHDAETPLEGLATITLLCADKDLERIDAAMGGAVRFESADGEPSTFLQEGGPRIASGLPGIPAPGNGGVPEDAPTAPPVVDGVVTTNSDVPGSESGGAAAGEGDGVDNGNGALGADSGEARGQDNELTAAGRGGSGPSSGLIALGGIALLLVAGTGYVFTRRPDADSAMEGR